MKIRYLRWSLLTVVVGALTWMALGNGERSFEAYCPFGGIESLYGLFREGQFTCALGPLNLSMLVAILVLTLLAKKAFCSWVCPIGFLGELLSKIGIKIVPGKFQISESVNRWFKLLRYISLAAVLFFTYRTGELILRGYDPFYAIFSGMGHGTLGNVTILVMSLIAIGSLVIPMFFCRYLCPLGAALDPFSKLGLIKICRNEETCIECGECQTACPHGLAPQDTIFLRDSDCTNCLECVEACPEEETLNLKLKL
ncbi:MAG: 4Fe-4S binding protein [Calditrichaeota bacterium]|jgi:polyferredoxin|nr:4Fe-4S binding protein [Calditrichota bacterium]